MTAPCLATASESVFTSVVLPYVSIDDLWWVLVAFLLVRPIRTDGPRWWLGVGAAIGLGMRTKYTMALLVAGVLVAVFARPLRRDLRGRWL